MGTTWRFTELWRGILLNKKSWEHNKQEDADIVVHYVLHVVFTVYILYQKFEVTAVHISHMTSVIGTFQLDIETCLKSPDIFFSFNSPSPTSAWEKYGWLARLAKPLAHIDVCHAKRVATRMCIWAHDFATISRSAKVLTLSCSADIQFPNDV